MMKSFVFVLQLAVLLVSVQAAPHDRHKYSAPVEPSSSATAASSSGASAPASTGLTLGTSVVVAPASNTDAGAPASTGLALGTSVVVAPSASKSNPSSTSKSNPPSSSKSNAPSTSKSYSPSTSKGSPSSTSKSNYPSTSKSNPPFTSTSGAPTSTSKLPPASSTTAPGTASPPTPSQNATCGTYVIAGQPGGFTKRTFIDFSKVNGGDATAFLEQNGMDISSYTVGAGPIPHVFTKDNVALGKGALNMKVSSYSGSGSILSSEIVTQEKFKYGSIRTVVKSSSTPGVCEGFFTYAGDNQEADWEILTSTTTQSSGPAVPAGIWATNQALNSGGKSTSKVVPVDSPPSQAFHELQIDWYPGSTRFFYDKVEKMKHTTNVPNADSNWIINAWSNGDKNWSAGPPLADSITQIRSILIYNGYTTNVKGTVCNI